MVNVAAYTRARASGPVAGDVPDGGGGGGGGSSAGATDGYSLGAYTRARAKAAAEQSENGGTDSGTAVTTPSGATPQTPGSGDEVDQPSAPSTVTTRTGGTPQTPGRTGATQTDTPDPATASQARASYFGAGAELGTGRARQGFARVQQAENRLEDILVSRQEQLEDPSTTLSRLRFARVEQAKQDLVDVQQQIDQRLERQVGAEKAAAARAGAAAGATSMGEVDPANLDPGQDYTVTRTSEGGVQAELTSDYRREFVSSQLDRQLDKAHGTDLETGEDYTIEPVGGAAAGAGGAIRYKASLTDSGQIQTATAEKPSSDAVRAFEAVTGTDLSRDVAIHKTGQGWLPSGQEINRAAQRDEAPMKATSGPLLMPTPQTHNPFFSQIGRATGEALNLAQYPKGGLEKGEQLFEAGSDVMRAGGPAFGTDLTSPGGAYRERVAASRRARRQSQKAARTAVAIPGAVTAYAAKNPLQAAGDIAFVGATAAAGAGASKIAGRAARSAVGRARTIGGTEVPLEDLTQSSVVQNIETGGAKGREFPAAQDAGLYRKNPAEAVRTQARDYTPDEVGEFFRQTGHEGPVLKKAVDVEPEGPGARGFRAQAGDYESPGSFVGPELSPYFLGIGRRSSFSMKPGVPDMGGRPTGVLIGTDVKNPTTARTLEEFNQELRERAGETTARTKPSGVGTPEEIEAVIPPEAEFARVGSSSRLRRIGERFGIGSQFYTKVRGQRVPLRPVRASDEASDAGGAASGTGSTGGGTATGSTLSEYLRPVGQPVDRPFPPFFAPSVAPSSAGGSSATSARFSGSVGFESGASLRVGSRESGQTQADEFLPEDQRQGDTVRSDRGGQASSRAGSGGRLASFLGVNEGGRDPGRKRQRGGSRGRESSLSLRLGSPGTREGETVSSSGMKSATGDRSGGAGERVTGGSLTPSGIVRGGSSVGYSLQPSGFSRIGGGSSASASALESYITPTLTVGLSTATREEDRRQRRRKSRKRERSRDESKPEADPTPTMTNWYTENTIDTALGGATFEAREGVSEAAAVQRGTIEFRPYQVEVEGTQGEQTAIENAFDLFGGGGDPSGDDWEGFL